MLTEKERYRFDNFVSPVASLENLGQKLHQKENLVVGVYDFADQGGAIGDIDLKDLDGKVVKIPDNAIITDGFVDTITVPDSGDDQATVAITLQTGADLMDATAEASVSGVVALNVTGAAGNMIKLTAERTLRATIATSALTSGKFFVFVKYVLSE